ncbi:MULTISPECIES: aminotransferase class III-fold pyridoxal phosphate-dependent enzyme [unclassified Sinorhizobium]|uniref:aspartate aminotransferase family protein n=1 Tax=unclassified Sinorhizobium TaxID=2613772 RepID=UPI0024C37BC4|nr:MULTISPECIES: aminotransferase class III-fold pyridoxal phosphate-dependent enzyme [unclassified Sinorhizobium]MDK1378237.1 aminotransferase class III-fold pyridoxal phosphate-dependent enzyme [Sinorhizobium sp. 6-70]MDK1480380.1 aminotransferase class III-fold pyridoxal phosphate-dependent enzyme [Sinorhizobium sp. 6-117]
MATEPFWSLNKMQHLVCGISSAGRIVPEVDGERFLVAKAEGPYVWDQRGRRYIDTALGFGATFLGHTDPVVTEAVRTAMERGSMPAYAHTLEEEAAASLAAHTRDLSKVIFLNSGSEAVHLACRTARKVTGRSKIVKAAAGYDGWFDDVAFGNAGSPEALMATNARPQNGDTLLLRFNDFTDADLLFSECDDVAAIVLEPMMANAGCVVAKPGYLEHVVALARRHGALVIMDEVLMGFRLHPGLASHYLGISPDLATVGKAIGNGFAVAALIGRPDIMAAFEEKRVTHAGTYNGNPVACAAVHAAMNVLDTVDYEALRRSGDALREAIRLAFEKTGTDVSTSGYGTVFTIWRHKSAPSDYNEAVQRADPAFVENMHVALRQSGVMSMFSTYGRHYISARSDQAVMEEMTEAFARAARSLAL